MIINQWVPAAHRGAYNPRTAAAGHVDVYHAISHFEIFQSGGAALQPETAST